MKLDKRGAVLLSTFTAFIWGLSFLSIKVTVAVIPPMTLGLLRFTIAAVILAAVLFLGRAKRSARLADMPRLAGAGLVGVTLYFLGENNGIMRLSASESSIIIGSIPVLTLVADRLFLKSRLGKLQIAGALLSALGVSAMVIESMRISADPLGYLYMAIAALSWVAYAFMTKPLSARLSTLEVTFWQSVFGALGFLPFALFETTAWTAVTPAIVLNIFYLGIFCSALGYLCYIKSLELLGASVSSVFINLIPVISVGAAFFLLGERLSLAQLAGGIVAVAGVYLTSLSRSAQQPAEAS